MTPPNLRSLHARCIAALTCGALAAAASVAACRSHDRDDAPPLKWSDIEALPQPDAGSVIHYGSEAGQIGELRLPKGSGPFPVVILLHGGCWQSEYSLDYMRSMATALTLVGLATWTLEYRRIGDPAGGFPNTFLDVAAGADYVRDLARSYPLDLAHVVAAGHSAGGHLALWLAARPRLPAGSVIRSADPLPVRSVVGLAAIEDLDAYARGSGSCNAAVAALMGGPPEAVAARYHDASPAALLPLGVAQFIVQGRRDPIVSPSLAEAYAAAANRAGDTVGLLLLEGAGHFDLVAPTTRLWPRIADAFVRAARH